MQISNNTLSYYVNSTHHIKLNTNNSTSQESIKASEEYKEQLKLIQQQVVKLRKSLDALNNPLKLENASTTKVISFGGTSAQPAIAASEISSQELTLDPGAKSVLKSTEEINTTATSFSTAEPQYSVSSAQVTLGGAYDGSNGVGTLTFREDRHGDHGVDDLKLKVYDPNGDHIEDINIDKEDPINQVYTLSNGITLTLGAGDILENNLFTIEVDGATPTSFDTTPPWQTESTAMPIITGVYDGAQGTGTFTFLENRSGTHGVDDLKFKVYDPNGDFLEDINIDKEDPINQEYTLSNGLVLTLGAGDLADKDSFTLDVYDAIGTTVDPDNAFNGIGDSAPRLEYGLSVTNGTFDVNGETITVNDTDSINDVLDKITASDAGVTATFDAANEEIVLTQKTAGSTQPIVVNNDTSGFLVAMKLDSAITVPGIDPDIEKPLDTIAQFSSVTDGTLLINGVGVAIDVSVDSLNDVIANINGSAANVTVSLNQEQNRVIFTENNANDDMVLDSNGTGFFAALEIADGTYQPTGEVPATEDNQFKYIKVETENEVLTDQRARAVAKELKKAADAFSKIFDNKSISVESDSLIAALRELMQDAVSEAFGSDRSKHSTKFGINFDFDRTSGDTFNFLKSNEYQLVSQLTTDGRPVNNLLFGSSKTNDGLVEKLLTTLEYGEEKIKEEIGSLGLFIDTQV